MFSSIGDKLVNAAGSVNRVASDAMDKVSEARNATAAAYGKVSEAASSLSGKRIKCR